MPESDDLISFAELAKLISNRPTSRTVYNWWRRGVLAESGRRVHLRSRKGPLGRMTSWAFYLEFLDAMNDGHTLPPVRPENPPAYRRNR